MPESKVHELFRRAIDTSDAEAMRSAIELLFVGGPEALSADAEYAVRHEDYVMDMPQSGERIRGRDAMRAMQEKFPTPPSISLRRVVGAGRVWVIEGVNDYAGDKWHIAVIFEFAADGRILRDTRYYVQQTEAPAWRAEWVEPI
jgi:hypothetical protein